MKLFRLSVIACAMLVVSGCAPKAAEVCEKWKENGIMPSPLENCRVCYDQMGDDIHAVRSCAFALEVNDTALGISN